MGKTYRSYQGREIDMDKIMTANELMPAVGNTRVNARGDELGAGGKIVKKREQIMAEYYERKPASPKDKVEPVRTKKEISADTLNSIVKRGNNDSKRQNTSVEE